MNQKVKTVIYVMLSLYIPMWSFFICNLIMIGKLNILLAIRPRTFSLNQIFAILGSWIPHISYTHIINNSIILFGLALSIAIIENKPFKLIWILIPLSGFFTWMFGGNNTAHIGASGLVFAMFGYVMSSLIIVRKWRYLFPVLFFFTYYGLNYISSFFHGLIPSQFVSFSAHFGGLISGIVVGIFYEKVKVKKSFWLNLILII